MQFHVGRNGQQLGQHSKDQLAEGLHNGTFFPTDLVWQEGMSSWLPLKEVLPEILPAPTPPDLNSVEVLPPNIPTSAFSGEVMAGTEPPASALSVTTLILGAFSLCCCQVSSIAGVILGHIALREIKKSEGKLGGSGMALIGLILSYIGLTFFVMSIILSQALPEETLNEWSEKIQTTIEEIEKQSTDSESTDSK